MVGSDLKNMPCDSPPEDVLSLQRMWSPKSKKNPTVSSCSRDDSDDDDEEAEWEGGIIREQKTRRFYNCVTKRNGSVKFKVGDDVLLLAPGGGKNIPYVAKIIDLYEDTNGEGPLKMSTVRWYYRERDCDGKALAERNKKLAENEGDRSGQASGNGPTRKNIGQEVFDSDFEDLNSVDTFLKVCYVLPFDIYMRNKFEGLEDVFFCRASYDPETHRFAPLTSEIRRSNEYIEAVLETAKRRREATNRQTRVGPEFQVEFLPEPRPSVASELRSEGRKNQDSDSENSRLSRSAVSNAAFEGEPVFIPHVAFGRESEFANSNAERPHSVSQLIGRWVDVIPGSSGINEEQVFLALYRCKGDIEAAEALLRNARPTIASEALKFNAGSGGGQSKAIQIEEVKTEFDLDCNRKVNTRIRKDSDVAQKRMKLQAETNTENAAADLDVKMVPEKCQPPDSGHISVISDHEPAVPRKRRRRTHLLYPRRYPRKPHNDMIQTPPPACSVAKRHVGGPALVREAKEASPTSKGDSQLDTKRDLPSVLPLQGRRTPGANKRFPNSCDKVSEFPSDFEVDPAAQRNPKASRSSVRNAMNLDEDIDDDLELVPTSGECGPVRGTGLAQGTVPAESASRSPTRTSTGVNGKAETETNVHQRRSNGDCVGHEPSSPPSSPKKPSKLLSDVPMVKNADDDETTEAAGSYSNEVVCEDGTQIRVGDFVLFRNNGTSTTPNPRNEVNNSAEPSYQTSDRIAVVTGINSRKDGTHALVLRRFFHPEDVPEEHRVVPRRKSCAPDRCIPGLIPPVEPVAPPPSSANIPAPTRPLDPSPMEVVASSVREVCSLTSVNGTCRVLHADEYHGTRRKEPAYFFRYRYEPAAGLCLPVDAGWHLSN